MAQLPHSTPEDEWIDRGGGIAKGPGKVLSHCTDE